MAAEATANEMPADERRSITTEREREILSGEADVDKKYFYTVVSRVRNKIEGLEDELDFLDEHYETLGQEMREVVCDDVQDSDDSGQNLD
jgi:hypothetical protein